MTTITSILSLRVDNVSYSLVSLAHMRFIQSVGHNSIITGFLRLVICNHSNFYHATSLNVVSARVQLQVVAVIIGSIQIIMGTVATFITTTIDTGMDHIVFFVYRQVYSWFFLSPFQACFLHPTLSSPPPISFLSFANWHHTVAYPGSLFSHLLYLTLLILPWPTMSSCVWCNTITRTTFCPFLFDRKSDNPSYQQPLFLMRMIQHHRTYIILSTPVW